MRDLLQDLRYALRSLRRSPGFTAMVVVSLAVGIGANAAIFSLVNALFLHELPVRQPGQLVFLSQGLVTGTRGEPSSRLDLYSVPLYQRLRADNQGDGSAFEDLAAEQSGHTRAIVEWSAQPGQASAELAVGRAVSANYFRVLGAPAQRGRTFLPEDETSDGANPVVVLSHGYWQRRFGGDPAIVGARLVVNGRPYTVTGVTQPGFTGSRIGDHTDLWLPLTMHGALARDRSIRENVEVWWVLVVGRLRSGVSLEAAEASANVSLQRFLIEHPALAQTVARRTGAVRIVVEPGATGMSDLRPRFREPLVALAVGVALLLLIVCLNVSHLLLARAVQRQREMGIRTALGATRARLARQLLAEGLLLCALGGAAAALSISWMIEGLLALSPGGETLEVSADLRVVAFTGALVLATALLVGLVPAWQASRVNLQDALRANAHSVTLSGSRRLVSRTLLISQVAFSLVLLVGAGLLSRSLGKLRQLEKGFDQQQLLLVQLAPREMGLRRSEAVGLYDQIIDRVSALPGVRGASLSYSAGRVLNPRGRAGDVVVPASDRSLSPVMGAVVTPDYFEVLGMPLLRGRGLAREDRPGAEPVVIVNETLARRLFGGAEAAVGRRLRFGLDSPARDLTVVGVVRDARTMALRESAMPTVYQPVAQWPDFLNSLEVRTFGDPAGMADMVRKAVHDAHPGLPIVDVQTVRTRVDRSLGQERLLAALSSAFGLAALFLVAVGLYGVIAQWAAQRTREIGVRMALGATAGGVRWLVLRQGLALVMVGIAVGLPSAIGASRLLQRMLFEVKPMDPSAVALALSALGAVAFLAAYLPARRASRLDPMVALKSE